MTGEPGHTLLLVEARERGHQPGRHTTIQDEAALYRKQREGQRLRLEVFQMFRHNIDGENSLLLVATYLDAQVGKRWFAQAQGQRLNPAQAGIELVEWLLTGVGA